MSHGKTECEMSWGHMSRSSESGSRPQFPAFAFSFLYVTLKPLIKPEFISDVSSRFICIQGGSADGSDGASFYLVEVKSDGAHLLSCSRPE